MMGRDGSVALPHVSASLLPSLTLPPGICCTLDLLHRVKTNHPIFNTYYLATQCLSAMNTERAYTLALRDLETGRFSSIWAAVKVYNLDNTNLGRRRRG